ncbi:MAG: HAMP domain-containing protein, partial [Burkholderiaceae bacterium]|nr:HAMP domain-containing protein [Burkholderiaceae bacterium]
VSRLPAAVAVARRTSSASSDHADAHVPADRVHPRRWPAPSLLAGWLTGPLSELAAATRSVARGDFRQVKDYTGRDELGGDASLFVQCHEPPAAGGAFAGRPQPARGSNASTHASKACWPTWTPG